MCLECEWRHGRKRWSREKLKILKKVSLELTVGQAGDNFVSTIMA